MAHRIDFHTHILPGLDDGSRSTEESLAILREEARQGITAVVCTPHFYPARHSPAQFLARRQQAWDSLRAHWQEGLPRVLLGAEVYYFEGIGTAEDLSALCLEGTNLLLLEMPLCLWTERMLSDILALGRHREIRVVLAHIERYRRLQPKKTLQRLLEAGVLMQANVSFFADWRTRPAAMAMARRGHIHILGSDCHSMGRRRPNWDALPPRARELFPSPEALLRQYALPGTQPEPEF